MGHVVKKNIKVKVYFLVFLKFSKTEYNAILIIELNIIFMSCFKYQDQQRF